MIVILDVDGVMTNGTKTYGVNGETVSKAFHDHDFTAIKKFVMQGWIVVWLSADETVNKAVAESRQIPFYNSRRPDGIIDKISVMHNILEDYNKTINDIIYVGDDLLDLPLMKHLEPNIPPIIQRFECPDQQGPLIFCPYNAAPQVKRVASVLAKNGGEGAIMDLYCTFFDDDEPPCT